MSARGTMSLVSSPADSLNLSQSENEENGQLQPIIDGVELLPTANEDLDSIHSIDDDDIFLERLRNEENKPTLPGNHTTVPSNLEDIATTSSSEHSHTMMAFDEEGEIPTSESSSVDEHLPENIVHSEIDNSVVETVEESSRTSANNNLNGAVVGEGSSMGYGDVTVTIESNTVEDIERTNNQAETPLYPLPKLSPDCFLSDGKRIIDMVIEYDVKKGGKDKFRNKIYRANFVKVLRKLGLVIEVSKSTTSKNIEFLKIHAPYDFLARHAEMIGLRVPIAVVDFESRPSLPSKLLHLYLHRNKQTSAPRPLQRYYCMRFDRDHLHCFLGYKKTDFLFSSIQRIQMVNSTIQRLTIKRLKRSWSTGEGDDNVSDEEAAQDDARKQQEDVSYQWLKLNGVFNSDYPLHDCADEKIEQDSLTAAEQPTRRYLIDNWGNFGSLFTHQPLDWIRAYFGTQIAFYFAWLGFYTKWLMVPAIFSIFCLFFGIRSLIMSKQVEDFCSDGAENTSICRECPSDACPFTTLKSYCQLAKFGSMFDNESTCIFAVMISLWSVFFVEYWKRYQNRLCSRWEGGIDDHVYDDVRPQFELTVRSKRVSPITKTEELYVPFRERSRRMLSSIMVISGLIMLLLVMLISTILYRSVAAILLSKTQLSLFISPAMAASLTSALANLIVIQIMSYVYPRVARRMTEHERPRTDADFETSFTYKVICFQYINFYGSLFYLAFFRGAFEHHPGNATIFSDRCSPAGCLVELSMQLIIIMTAKQSFQNLMEVGLPKIQNWLRRCRQGKKRENATRWEEDCALNPVSLPIGFADYAEMMIQYGFLTMFAPAFPLAAFFAWLNNIFEIRIDATNYLSDTRRTVPKPISNIGAWQEILETTTRVAVVVNAFLIAFTSQTLDEVYYQTHFGGTNTSYLNFTFSRFNLTEYPLELRNSSSLQKGHCYYKGMFYGKDTGYERRPDYWYLLLARLAFVIVFEHTIFLVQSIVQGAIPDEPDDVGKFRLREQHLQKQKFMQEEFGKDYEEKLENVQNLNSGEPENEEMINELISNNPTPLVTSHENNIQNNSAVKSSAGVRYRIFRRRKIQDQASTVAPSIKNDAVIDDEWEDVDLNSSPGYPRRSSISKSAGSVSTLRKNHGRKRKAKRQKGHFMGRMLRRLVSCDM